MIVPEKTVSHYLPAGNSCPHVIVDDVSVGTESLLSMGGWVCFVRDS